MAPRLFGKKRKAHDNREIDGMDWADFVVQGASVTLALVKEAAEFAPVPGLKQAAGTTLQILSTIQAVKDNKSAFRLLGDEATALIAVIWRSFQTSLAKESWPPPEFRPVIEELVLTLASINEYARNKLDRGTAARLVYSMQDPMKITEYREKLRHAVNKFEVSSHLNIVDSMQRLMDGQKQILDQIAAKGITVDKTDTQNIFERLKVMKIEDPIPTMKLESSDSNTVQKVEIPPKQLNDPPTHPVHAGTSASGQNPSEISIDEVLAEAKRFNEAREREHLAGKFRPNNQKDDVKWYRQPTVETDEEDNDDTKKVEDDRKSSTDSEDSEPIPMPQPKAAKRHKNSSSPKSTRITKINVPGVTVAMGDRTAEGHRTSISMNVNTSFANSANSVGNMNAPQENMYSSTGNMNASMGNTPSAGYQDRPQSTPMFQSHSPNPHFQYSPFNPYFNPYNPPPFPSYSSPGSTPTGPSPGQSNPGYHSIPNMFGSGTYVNNVNSGNVVNTTISGVGNDNRVINYGVTPRRKRRN